MELSSVFMKTDGKKPMRSIQMFFHLIKEEEQMRTLTYVFTFVHILCQMCSSCHLVDEKQVGTHCHKV